MSSDGARLSRVQRRRMRDAQRRVESRRQALPQDPPPLRDPFGQGQVATGPFVGSVAEGAEGSRRWPTRVGFVAAWVTLVMVVMVSAAVATPVFGGGWDLWLLLAGGAAGGAAGTAVVWASRRVRRRSRVVATVVAASLAVLYVWGAATQVVIDGRPYLHTSETARAWRLSQDLLSDMNRMAELDVLLGYDLVGARSNLRRYDPAAVELAQIAARWANTEISAVPDDRFIPIMRHLATSADFGSQAMRRKYELALQYDARGEAELQSWRATFVRELLTAGPLLAELSASYGFDLLPREGGVAE
jgi:hypothetical protein